MSAIHYEVPASIHTDRLCVFYDAGETNALKPVLEEWDEQNINFKVLVMATAETIQLSQKLNERRITLKSLGIDDEIDNQTARTTALSQKALNGMHEQIKPKIILVGTASKIQEQILTEYCDEATTFAFVDNFNYDINHESFKTVKKVQAAAHHVLCPSQHVADLLCEKPLESNNNVQPTFHVVGKPSLEAWEKEIATVNHESVLNTLKLSESGGSIITFIGGYGPGYEIINPLFVRYSEQLREEGYQVILQPHPKIAQPVVKTTEALAVSSYIIGYNSSVMFDAAVIGKNALFMIPDEIPYDHFAIKNGLMAKVANIEELLKYIHEEKTPKNIRDTLKIPQNSIERISKLVEQNRMDALLGNQLISGGVHEK